jgi:hypothetical protein
MNHGRFTDCHFLRAIGRNLLKEFFDKFEPEVAVPPPTVSDDEFFTSLSRLLMSPEGLPDRVNDVLHEIQELSTQAGHDCLKASIGMGGLQLELDGKETPEELALRVWLNSPDVLARKYNEQRFSRSKGFVFFERDRYCLPLVQEPGEKRADLSALIAHLDGWFGQNGRGKETVLVERYPLNGEDWFLIRHGDTYLRSSRIENRKVEVLHYRPAKDDLVVYNPERDELRIHAKTRGEQDLYRAAFGQYLHGFENYFRSTDSCCLDPLRELGAEALECADIPGIKRVVLTQLELLLDREEELSTKLKGKDLLATKQLERGAPGLGLPADAVLKEAAFHIFIGDAVKPLKVKIIPPNTIRLENKQASVRCVEQFLAARRFKRSGAKRRESIADNQ